MNYAIEHTDFLPIADMDLVINGTQQEINFSILIINDDEFEYDEKFTVHLALVSSNVNVPLNPSQTTITITENACKI